MKATFAPSPFFVLRTPLLPFETLEAWSEELEAPALLLAEEGELRGALSRDRARVLARLRALVARPLVREALFLASPSLDEALRAWESDPDHPRAHDVTDALVRYLTRMSARPTPFGLFSGCSTGALAPRTRLALGPDCAHRRHTRLDMHYLCALTEALERDPHLRSSLRYRPTSALYPSAGQLRYAEGRVDPDTRERRNDLVSVEAPPYLRHTLERASLGATPGELVEALVKGEGVAFEEARAYIDELIDSQVLVPELAPSVTGEEPLLGVLETLRSRAPEHPAAAVLEAVRAELQALDSRAPGQPSSRYHSLAGSLGALPARPDLARLFHVDLFKSSPELSLGADVRRELDRALSLLQRLTPQEVDSGPLQKFIEDCAARHGGGLVPLMDVLDEERGVGFGTDLLGSEPSPLLRGLHLPVLPTSAGVPFGPREEWLLRRLGEIERAGLREWVLDPGDLEALEARVPARLPDAFAVMATVAAPSQQALDRGGFRVLVHGVSGPSGARLLGRFCHGDPGLRGQVEAHLRAEEALRPDAVFAELVHLPQGRLGNVICRPALRGYEIPYLGRSGAPEDRQIPITDLWIAVPSTQGERVVLWSQSLGREVLVRLTSAHNYGSAELGLYRFLGALQAQNVSEGLSFRWGPLEGARYLPRVSCGKVVLALARWTLAKRDLARLALESESERYRALQGLCQEQGLPRWVCLSDEDKVLPLDLRNPVSAETFVRRVKQRSEVTLTELFPGPDELCAEGPSGRFVHELVVPYVRQEGPSATGQAEPVVKSGVPRSFPPGSSWLYAVISTGTMTADSVLRSVVRPLVDEALASGAADRWFFIRYSDPRWQIRVRLRGDPARLAGFVLPRLDALLRPTLDDRRVWRVRLETYERETERYGGDQGIELAEEIFQADSEAALSIVSRLSGDEGADARWRLCLRGIHRLLCDLGLDLPRRIQVLTRVREGFAATHRVDGAFESRLSRRFREERASLEELLSSPPEGEHPLAPGFAILEERGRRLAPLVAELRRREGLLLHPIDELADSYIHMFANRLLLSDHLHQELVLYDFLLRLSLAEAARARA